jgi:hypothetical protein
MNCKWLNRFLLCVTEQSKRKAEDTLKHNELPSLTRCKPRDRVPQLSRMAGPQQVFGRRIFLVKITSSELFLR